MSLILVRDPMIILARDRPIFGFYRYIGIGQNGWYYQPQQELIKRCYIPHASRQLAQGSTAKQVETVILQQRYQVRFHKQTDKINRGACVGRHNRNKSINGMFRSARSHHVQVLCTNQPPLYFRMFSQHKKFDCNLMCRSPSDA